MTTEKLELAKKLKGEIEKLRAFLHYYNDGRYSLQIRLNAKDYDSAHSESVYLKESYSKLREIIEQQLKIKLAEMQKCFDEL